MINHSNEFDNERRIEDLMTLKNGYDNLVSCLLLRIKILEEKEELSAEKWFAAYHFLSESKESIATEFVQHVYIMSKKGDLQIPAREVVADIERILNEKLDSGN